MNIKQVLRTIFTFSITLFLASAQLHAGMISKISRVIDGKKNIIFFHDIHCGSQYVGNRKISVVDGAHKQLDGIDIFFDQLLTTTASQKIDVLIECRDDLEGCIRSAEKQNTDFEGFFKRFYAHMASGQQLDKELLQRINLNNIDCRTELDSHIDHLLDRVKPLVDHIAKHTGYGLENGLISDLDRSQFEHLDKKKKKVMSNIIADRQYQLKKQKEIDHFNKLIAHRNWYQQNKTILDQYLHTIKQSMPEKAYIELYEQVQKELQLVKEIITKFEGYAKQSGQNGLLAGIFAWLESQEGSFAQLYDDLWALFYNDVMKVDLCILQEVFKSQAPWVIVHVGSYHLSNVMQHISKLGLYIDQIDPLASQKYLEKNHLANELQTLLDIPDIETDVSLVQQLQNDYMLGHTTTAWSWLIDKINRAIDWVSSLFS